MEIKIVLVQSECLRAAEARCIISWDNSSAAMLSTRQPQLADLLAVQLLCCAAAWVWFKGTSGVVAGPGTRPQLSPKQDISFRRGAGGPEHRASPWQQARCAVMVKEAFLFPGLSGGLGAVSTGYASSSGVFKNIYLDLTLKFF